MIWQKQVLEQFSNLNLELRNTIESNSIKVVIPQWPDAKTQSAIKKLIPYEVEFLLGVKLKTQNAIAFHLSQAKLEATQTIIARSIKIEIVKGELNDETFKALYETIETELINDGYYENWEVCYEGGTLSNCRWVKKAIATRKVSGTGLDDMDLKIALGINQDVNDFLKMLEGNTFSPLT